VRPAGRDDQGWPGVVVTAPCKTCAVQTWPLHMWKHDVITRALAMGATIDLANEIANEITPSGMSRSTLWYEAGEFPETAADMLAAMAKNRARLAREDDCMRVLRNVIYRGVPS
jgi:hypothetical protein